MSAVYVTLKIVYPDNAVDHAETADAVIDAADLLAEHLSATESYLSNRLPEGWYVKVYEMEAD